ncbi:MAG TPA: hypothetical protein VK843_02095 [Planctomycetota bacterium]|nr:hypothetical protein [Planctomycetota bacterium]
MSRHGLKIGASLVLALLFAWLALGQKPPEKIPERVEIIESLDLVLSFPPVLDLKRAPWGKMPLVIAAWSGTCGNSKCEMTLRSIPIDEYPIDDPHDVLGIVLENHRKEQPSYAFDETSALPGPFGIVPYAFRGRTQFQEPGTTKAVGIEFVLCATTDQLGYVVEMRLEPLPDSASLESARKFLATGITWRGKPRDPKWTQEELQARWDKTVADPDKSKLDKVLRTEHYVILTDSSGGKNFAEKMEECYTRIKSTFAFDELPGELLMPVFLFRTQDEYYAFFTKQFGVTVEQAQRSKGVARGDFYATWYEAPNDSVHIHEATHQIFSNRLRLSGGGSWFQEGVAEYMSTIPTERGTAARAVQKGRYMPLAQFVTVKSLLFSAKNESKSGEDEAASQYELAAFLIEFARESKFAKDRFVEWFHAIGETPRNDLKAIEAATRKTLGVDLAGLQAEWEEYAKKR